MSATRKLAAILAADVVGYARLMGADEEGTLARLKAYRRDVIDPKIKEHHGRIVKTTGDGMLVEFASPVEAVRCAVGLQQALAERNSAADDDPKIEFRVGINLGDVISDQDDIYGDGVNVAARLEAMAEPGSVVVSGVVYDQVRDKVPFYFDDLGEQSLKNISRPVRVFRASPASVRGIESRAALPLPNKPSVAVLPFTNMSGDPEQEYFADGIVEDIISALSRFPWLFVIARNSSFAYKGRSGVDVRQVGRELGVRYILEGSVRKAADRVRISGQLIDASSGVHLWADRYEGVYTDIFDLQDRITLSVICAIEPRLISAEIERAQRKRPDSLDAYDLLLRALPHVHAMTKEGNVIALSLLDRALAIDPHYAAAAGLAAWCYTLRMAHSSQSLTDVEKHTGIDLAYRAIAKGANDPDALAMGGYAVAWLTEERRAGLRAIERATELNPNSAQALSFAGWVHIYVGEAATAVTKFERSIRLSPRDLTLFRMYAGLSYAYLCQQRFDDAVVWGRRALAENPNFTTTYRALGSALGLRGDIEEGQEIIRRWRTLVPGMTISKYLEVPIPMHSSGYLPLLLEGLRRAGLPE